MYIETSNKVANYEIYTEATERKVGRTALDASQSQPTAVFLSVPLARVSRIETNVFSRGYHCGHSCEHNE
jgi:hypothetical protein